MKQILHRGLVLAVLCIMGSGYVMADNQRSSQAEQLYGQADSLYGVQQYKQALQVAKQALEACQSGGGNFEADCLSLLAIINIRLSDYDEAAKYAMQCYALDEKTGDPDVMSSSLNTLAAIYMGANRLEEAEQYVLKGIEMAGKADNPGRMAVLQAMASEVYHAQGDDQKALPYIERAYEIDKQLGNEPRMMVRLAQKASVLIGLHHYQEAEQVLSEVIPFLRNTPDSHSLAIACNKMGMALLSQHQEQKATPYYREAAQLFASMGDIYNEVHARKGLYESLWKSTPDAAKVELDRFNDLKDSIYNNTSADALARYNAEFGNDWLQIENHEERQAKLKAITIGIVVALLLIILSVAIWWVMRRRHRRQQAINADLSEHIRELNRKYDVLSEHYDHAITTSDKHHDSTELTESDRRFIENTIVTVNRLILEGQPDANLVAEKMGMSLYQLRQRLASVTGQTPQDFIAAIRMRKARHLLDNHPEMNIAEIGTLCAYSDTPNFTRAFKKTFGLTPTQYLERQKEPKPISE